MTNIWWFGKSAKKSILQINSLVQSLLSVNSYIHTYLFGELALTHQSFETSVPQKML